MTLTYETPEIRDYGDLLALTAWKSGPGSEDGCDKQDSNSGDCASQP